MWFTGPVTAQGEDQRVLQVSAHDVGTFSSSWRMVNRSGTIDEIVRAAFLAIGQGLHQVLLV